MHVLFGWLLLGMSLCEKELRILGIQPMTGDAWPGGSQCLLATEMALEGINRHPDLLRGFKLVYDYIDDEVIILVVYG